MPWKQLWKYGFNGVPNKDVLIISWAARWEYDKGPDRLLQILEQLDAKGVNFAFNLMGQSFRNSPPEYAEIKRRFAHRLLVAGYVEDRNLYREALRHSHVFLSTAYHEFQGLAVMEAALAGCTPVVPDEQAYPEFYPEDLRYASVSEAVDKLKALARLVEEGAELPRVGLAGYLWESLGPVYRRELERLAGACPLDNR